MRIDHFAFLVKDLDAAISFYKDNLGLTLISREKDLEHGEEFAFFELENGKLELLRKISPSGSFSTPFSMKDNESRGFCPHLAVQSEDLDATVAMLEKKSINILKGPLLISNLVKWLYITDPDGNIIEFVEWIKH
ncbi:MAG: VOC family protein [Promethearchaeota archaeon]